MNVSRPVPLDLSLSYIKWVVDRIQDEQKNTVDMYRKYIKFYKYSKILVGTTY